MLRKFENFVATVNRVWSFGKMLQRLWDHGYTVAVYQDPGKSLRLLARPDLESKS